MAPGPPSGPREGAEARLLWPVAGRRISEMPNSTGNGHAVQRESLMISATQAAVSGGDSDAWSKTLSESGFWHQH